MKKLFIFCSLLFFLTSCVNREVYYPDCGVETNHLNNELKISIVRETTTFEIDDFIFFVIRNTSNNRVFSTENFNIQLYLLSEEGWEKIKDETLYPFSNLSDKKLLSKDVLAFSPEIPDSYENATIYVCIYGTIEDNNEKVAASSIIQLYRSDD